MTKVPKGHNEPWTQDQIDLLHEMVQEYALAKAIRRKLWFLGVWVLGVPAAVLTFWEPIVRLWKLFKGV